jgi:hypothetical protein
VTFEELYKLEFEHRERVRAAVNVPVGLLVVIGGLLGVMLQSPWFEKRFICVWFWLAVIGSSMFFIRAIYCLIRSYHGHRYKMMPFAREQRDYRCELRDWHVKQGRDPDRGDRDFAEWIEALYVEAADYNAQTNLAKSEYLFRANSAVVNCLVLAAVTFIPFAIHRLSSPAAAQKVEIVNASTLSLGQETSMPRENPRPAAPIPPKPTPPPLRELREGEIPSRKK